MKKNQAEFCDWLGRRCYMAKDGMCTYSLCGCSSIIDKCEGCENVAEINGEKYCKSFVNPSAQWNYGICYKATHKKEVYVDPRKARKLNPIKSSKRKHGA